MFEGLYNLEWLKLMFNDITTIEKGSFANLTQVTKLEIAHNKLHPYIGPGMFDGLESLEGLDLSFNEIATIEEGTFIHLQQFTSLRFQYNQFTDS